MAVAERVHRTRLLYLYPSELSDGLIDVMGATGCPYFDLSLQHVSRPHSAAHAPLGRWRPVPRAGFERIRAVYPDAALRSSFIVGYPGETEEDHDQLLAFLDAADLDWVGFFPFSPEEGTYAMGLPDQVAPGLWPRAAGRVRRAAGRHHRPQAPGPDRAAAFRSSWTSRARARSHREAPEIDGIDPGAGRRCGAAGST